MKLYFLKDINQHKAGGVAFVELTLGRRFVDKGVAIPYVTHLDDIKRVAQEKEDAEKEALLKKEKAALLKKKEESNEEAVSKKVTRRSKAVKK